MTQADKPVRLSEWAKEHRRQVTRGEFLNVTAILIERRFQLERLIQHSRKWRVRFWRWMTDLFNPQRPPTEVELDELRQRALSPTPGEADQETDEAEGDVTEPEPESETPFKPSGDGVKFRDLRRRRSDG
jgi:hypothetical protein